MNKSILSFLLLLSPFFVMAKGSSHPASTSDSPKSTIVDISYAQRVLIFDHNDISVDGIILVCDRKYEVFKRGVCVDSNNQNQWMDIENIRIPNFELTGFEYVGIRLVIAFFFCILAKRSNVNNGYD